MTDNIVDFVTPKPPELLVGPFEEYRVVIQGRFVPRLTGYHEKATGKVWLVVDRRFGQDFSTEADAYSAAVLIAQAMAIASGYPHFGAESRDQPFAPRAIGIDAKDAP